jgi:hypothetical protein
VAALIIPYYSAATAYALAGLIILGSLLVIFLLESAPYERQAKVPKTFLPSDS